jgi:hypothetical protein
METRLCSGGCGKPTNERHRRLCWRCTNLKHRYGLTYQEMQEQKQKTAGCFLCLQPRKYLAPVQGVNVCSRCQEILRLVQDTEWLGRVTSVISGHYL